MATSPSRRTLIARDSHELEEKHRFVGLSPWQTPVEPQSPVNKVPPPSDGLAKPAAASHVSALNRLFQPLAAQPNVSLPVARAAAPIRAVGEPAVAADIRSLQASSEFASVGCPWGLDANEETAVPVACKQRKGSAPSTSHAGSTWTSSFSRQTVQDCSPATSVWRRWIAKAEDFATAHVSDAYAGLQERLLDVGSQATSGSPVNGLTAMLAFAGADFADHEATMQQVRHLLRNDMPDSSLALVGPQDFRSLSHVMECICAQFLPESVTKVNPSGRRLRLGLPDFLTWYHTQRMTGDDVRRPVVLLVQQFDAIPKDLVKDMLSSLSSACGGLPILVVFGLRLAPEGAAELLDGGLSVGLRIVESIDLFDAKAITSRLLEELFEDGDCPLALSPTIISSLRKEFNFSFHSLHYILKLLGLICNELVPDKVLAPFVLPFPGPEDTASKHHDTQEDLKKMFAKRLKDHAVPLEVLQGFTGIDDIDEMSDACVGGDNTIQSQVAQSAAEACLWRKRLCSSLGLWDELLCAVQPSARFQARTYRLEKLLAQLWPQADVTFEEQRANVEELIDNCLRQLLKSSLKRDGIDQLMELFFGEAASLDQELQDWLDKLDKSAPMLNDVELRKRIGYWLKAVTKAYWQPLDGAGRQFFLALFANDRNLVAELEFMSGRKCAAELVLSPLAHGSASGSCCGWSDAALLHRFLESSNGRAVEICELWRSFENLAPAYDAAMVESAAHSDADMSNLQRRFSQGVFALYAMGLFNPKAHAAGMGRAEKKKRAPFDGWRLKRQVFGRAWLQEEREQKRLAEEEARQLSALSERDQYRQIDRNEESEFPDLCRGSKHGPAAELLQRIRMQGAIAKPPATLRRPNNPSPPAKRRKVARTAKLFMQ